jgi:ribosomal protein S18 acetylase RimI-like enzyme
MYIRPFERKDIKQVLEINKTCHKKPQPDSDLMEIIDKGDVWVAESNGALVGFLISIYREGPYVFNVAVLPGYRKLGTGTALFKQFETYSSTQGYTFSYLYVDYRNSAQKLYFDLGYRVVGIKKDFYGAKENALVMMKYFE